jgi:3-oxoacyl-(acyl-carrier-protein) synthase
VSALKPYIGHALGASALLETSIMLLFFEYNTILPILNSKDFYSSIKNNIASTKICYPLKRALKTCTAFAGFNASCVFEKVDL